MTKGGAGAAALGGIGVVRGVVPSLCPVCFNKLLLYISRGVKKAFECEETVYSKVMALRNISVPAFWLLYSSFIFPLLVILSKVMFLAAQIRHFEFHGLWFVHAVKLLWTSLAV